MRKVLTIFLIMVLMMFALPPSVAFVYNRTRAEKEVGANGDAITTGSFDESFKVTVYLKENNVLKEVGLEEYLVGVLAGEMPPTYETEALKAQAVAARSYILSRVAEFLSGSQSDGHNGAMLCNDYKHCKAWTSIGEAKKKWDPRYADDYERKLREAVAATKGEYMIYDNKVVKAYFYAMSSGRTENVEEVWGTALPYLKSVPSKGDIGADGYESLSSYPKDMFVSKLKAKKPEVVIEKLSEAIGEIKRTEGGSVSMINIGGADFSGQDMREIFGLRSSNFNIELSGDKVTFRVRGYGHGVGMSQNGANAMAKTGDGYKQILKHYYTDVSIVNLYKKG